jgi:hypothetical protein
MTSLGTLESLAAQEPLFESVGEALAAADEAPLALFIGVNHLAYLFTTRRFLLLKRARPLARELAGRKIIDFMRAPVEFGLEDVLSKTRIKAEFAISEVAYLEAERVYSAGAVMVYARGRKHTLTLGHKRAEIAPYTDELRARLGIPKSAASVVMKRELKAWTILSIATGATSLLLSFVFPSMLDPIWGLTLVIVGLGILCSAEPAMFIILGVGMVWAALLNLLGLTSSPLRGGNLQFAPFFQLYWAGVLFTKYRKYEHLYDHAYPSSAAGASSSQTPSRLVSALGSLAAALPGWRRLSASVADHAIMPLLSLFIAAVEVLLLLSLFEASLLQWPQKMIALLSRGHLHLAMVGGAIGLASLYSRRGARWAAMAGLMVNAVMAVTIVSLLVLGWLSK